MELKFPAEWQKQCAIQFTFPHNKTDWQYMLNEASLCFAECITQTSLFQKVIVVCQNKEEVLKYLTGAKQENLILVKIPTNDTWARDHAAITIFKNGQPHLLDFTFNGWGNKFPAEKDNLITRQLYSKGVFTTKSIEHFEFVLEGGAIETDGEGTLLTTTSCLLSKSRNPQYSKVEIEQFLIKHLGVKRILWLNSGYLEGDDTDGHIDTLARFCNPNTIAYVKCTNPEDEHFLELNKMEQELKALRTAQNKAYNLIPLPWPEPCFDKDNNRLPATYANFLIINEAVLVPVYQIPQDEEALSVIASCFPNRKIIPINCRPLIEQHGSLHCISMQFPEGVIN